jgi:urease accessory protein
MATTMATDRRPSRAGPPSSSRPSRPPRSPRLSGLPLTAHALLHLMWLSSPALPVGGFSYSEGLEAAIEAGRVATEGDTQQWLCDQLHLSLARSDMAVVHQALRAWHRGADTAALRALNDWVLATRESAEARLQTEQMGRSLAEWLKNQGTPPARLASLQELAPCPTWPVVYALAAAETGAPAREVLLAFGFGWAENMVQAALKSVPLGQNAGQRILAQLVQTLPAAVDQAMRLAGHERQAFTPMLAILSSRHETQYSRLFRS